MHQIAVLFARVLSPALGVLLGLLGFATLGENLLGWLLFVAGIVYAAGTIIVAYVQRRGVSESQAVGNVTALRANDRSFWLLTAGLVTVFFLPPLEFLYFGTKGLPVSWLEITGACVAGLGGIVFAWARRSLPASNAVRQAGGQDRPANQAGPYRFIRYPAYAGYLLAALGLALGYGSTWGAAALLIVLLPAVLWRIRVEDQQRAAQFGAQSQESAAKTKRLIPGVW